MDNNYRNKKIIGNLEVTGEIISDSLKKQINKNLCQEITYADLKAKRDAGQLVPGMSYRIIDYVTTTSQPGTTSACHPFDIIVISDDEKTLNENARAITNKMDISYFCRSPRQLPLNESAIAGQLINDQINLDISYLIQDKTETFKVIEKTLNKITGEETYAIYLNDDDGYPGELDREQGYYLDGEIQIDGTKYYKWRRFEKDRDTLEYNWLLPGGNDDVPVDFPFYLLTNINILNDNLSKVSDLSAWKLKYCIDNDTARFSWAGNQPITSFKIKTINDVKLVGSLMADNTINSEDYRIDGINSQDTLVSFGIIKSPIDGQNTCVLYKTDKLGLPPINDSEYINPDLDDPYLYNGNIKIDGIVYDRWRKYDLKQHIWADTIKGSAYTDTLTNSIVEFISGKGVIYELIDEYNNHCFYDFKNIQFKRDTAWFNLHKDWCNDNLGFIPDKPMFFYTFSYIDDNNNIFDYTLIGNDGKHLNDEDKIEGVYDNEISQCSEYYVGLNKNSNFALSANCFISSSYWDSIFYGIHSNRLGSKCYNNTFGSYCSSNTFGSNCNNNIFGSDCYSNTFGSYCSSNTFGSNCNDNTFDSYCSSNTFSSNCNNNIFGSDCYSNTFGSSCYNNTFGPDCYSNTFGSSCYNNTFGPERNNNTFGVQCSFNIIESTDSNLKYINTTDKTNNNIQNIHVYPGLKGNSAELPKVIQVPKDNKTLIEFKPLKATTVINPAPDINYYYDDNLAPNAQNKPFHDFTGTTDELFNILGAGGTEHKWTDMYYMFSDCRSLTTIPQLDTSNVTNMDSMFYGCESLTTIPQLDTSNVTNMYEMFDDCWNLKTIPLLDTSKVTDMSDMFLGETGEMSLQSIPKLDTSKVIDMNYMFYNCTSLISIPQLDTSNVTGMYGMFGYCTSLTTIPQLDTINVTNMGEMFTSCSSLTSIPLLNTISVTSMLDMFNSCESLTLIPLLDTRNVTNMSGMFGGCTSLISIPQLDTSKVTDAYNMFNSCTSLKEIHMININANLDIHWSTLMEKPALVELIGNLKPQTNPQTPSKTLTLGPTLKAKLSAAEIQVATDKGWTIA